MRKPEFKVTFQPSGRSVFAIPGTILIETAARAGCVIATPCGGSGSCGKCSVRIISPENPPVSESDSAALSKEQIEQGFRLACSFKIDGPTTIDIPTSALFQSSHKILSAHGDAEMEVSPEVTIHDITPDASQEECCSLTESVARALPEITLSSTAKNQISNLQPGEPAYLITSGDIGVRVEQQKPSRITGVAFDIGTTTIVGTLVDLQSGEDIALASTINPQTAHGDDLISRIKMCRDDKEGLQELSQAIRGAVNKIVQELSANSGVQPEDIFYAVFAGNTAMQQIMAGIDTSGLAEIPFEPAFTDALKKCAHEIELNICPDAEVLVFPQIGGFVGGDTVAGILATRLDTAETPSLMVDVGTNGEIVLSANGRLLAASVAAGPAFEGARIINGMRASAGAIEKVSLNTDDIQINVIANAQPSGICGTGLIDAAAILLDLGVIDMTGRIVDTDELPDDILPAIKARIIESDMGFDFVLVAAEESATGENICLHQRDIRELQLANGAIRAGINILLKTAGIEADDLSTVLLAGAFGNFIRRNHARRIGMLPQIPSERIRFVGNTASFGAKRVLLSKNEAQYAQDIREKTEHIDLSSDPDFQEEFGAAMLFPES